MDPWPPPGPGDRQPLARQLALWRDPAVRACLRRVRRRVAAGSIVAAAGPASGLLALDLVRARARRVSVLEGESLPWSDGALAAALHGSVRFLSPVGQRLAAPADLILLDPGGGAPAWSLALWAAAAWARCGGPATRVVPSCLRLVLAPTRDPILHGAAAVFWRRGVVGVRLASAARTLWGAPVLTRTARIDWLAAPAILRYPLAAPGRLAMRARFRADRDGDLTGFALATAPEGRRAGRDGLAEEGLLLPLPRPARVERGSLIRAAVVWEPGRAGGRWEWRWTVEGSDGGRKRGRRAYGTVTATAGEARAVGRQGGGGRRRARRAGDPDPQAGRGMLPGRDGGGTGVPAVRARLLAGRGGDRDLRPR